MRTIKVPGISDQSAKFSYASWASEEEALPMSYPNLDKGITLLESLDALRDDLGSDLASERDQRTGQCSSDRVTIDPPRQLAVKLDDVRCDLEEHGETRKARTCIVDCDPHPKGT